MAANAANAGAAARGAGVPQEPSWSSSHEDSDAPVFSDGGDSVSVCSANTARSFADVREYAPAPSSSDGRGAGVYAISHSKTSSGSSGMASSPPLHQPVSAAPLSNTPPPPSSMSASGSGGGVLSSRAGGTVNRKDTYKAQKKSYAREKKRVERELLSTFKDESIIVLADWLKVRGSLKSWTKLWCVLKPGLLLLYRSDKTKSSNWVGTVILSTCTLIERPSKKDGYCFKLYHPMFQSIWANRGPQGETMGAVVQPLPTNHLIFRAPNNAAGKCWMDALELALRCSSLLLRTMGNKATVEDQSGAVISADDSSATLERSQILGDSGSVSLVEATTMDESDVENHFKSELEGDEPSVDLGEGEFADEEDDMSDGSSVHGRGRRRRSKSSSVDEGDSSLLTAAQPTPYESDPSAEVFGEASDQTEEISEENKSIVWFLMKQVRPGMDLSKVVLPTFILEPRSFLDKLTDYYYHNDLISRAVKEESPFERMKAIVKWYLSGFYKKPKGLKKPYNPILGETFRCFWELPNGSKTFYIAEQVSHHPPISAFYVTNRQEGFTMSSSILAKSKFYGNSTSAILDGVATLSLLPRGEDYKLTMPYAHCKGIIMGTMTMELGGKVTIECSKTGYSTELEFKLRPFLGGGEFTNAVSGKIKLVNETLATLDGHWDDKVVIKHKQGSQSEVFWQVTPQVMQARLRRFTVPLGEQGSFESVKLWQKVSRAIEVDDQTAATEEKTVLEEAQRAGARERKALGTEWIPKHFELNSNTGQYEYKHADLRPWDPMNDLYQYEKEYVISTKTRHRTPMIRTQSIVSVSEAAKSPDLGGASGDRQLGVVRESSSVRRRKGVGKYKSSGASSSPSKSRSPGKASPSNKHGHDSGSTIPEESDGGNSAPDARGQMGGITLDRLQEALAPLEDQQRDTNDRLGRLQRNFDLLMYQQKERDSASNINRDMVLLVVLVVMIQALLNWYLTHKAQQQAGVGGN